MREILFRGKGTIDSGFSANKWVYGYYCKDFWRPRKGHGILPVDKECGGYVEVDPETVGQFTGLTDKNGKRIFEGDIIKHYNRDDDQTAFDVGRVFWDSTKCRWLRTSSKCDYNPEMWSSSARGYVVIGNIHDNPDLQEG